MGIVGHVLETENGFAVALFCRKFVGRFGAVVKFGVVGEVPEENRRIAEVGLDLRQVVEHVHRDKRLIVFGKDIGQLVHGRCVVGANAQRLAVGGGAFFVSLVQAVHVAQVNKEVDFFGMRGIAFADNGYGAVKIVERDVRFRKLVDDANVFLVEPVGFLDGAECADRVAHFTVGFAQVKPTRNIFGFQFQRAVVRRHAFGVLSQAKIHARHVEQRGRKFPVRKVYRLAVGGGGVRQVVHLVVTVRDVETGGDGVGAPGFRLAVKRNRLLEFSATVQLVRTFHQVVRGLRGERGYNEG